MSKKTQSTLSKTDTFGNATVSVLGAGRSYNTGMSFVPERCSAWNEISFGIMTDPVQKDRALWGREQLSKRQFVRVQVVPFFIPNRRNFTLV